MTGTWGVYPGQPTKSKLENGQHGPVEIVDLMIYLWKMVDLSNMFHSFLKNVYQRVYGFMVLSLHDHERIFKFWSAPLNRHCIPICHYLATYETRPNDLLAISTITSFYIHVCCVRPIWFLCPMRKEQQHISFIHFSSWNRVNFRCWLVISQ
jgi:hypothetical protein